jgi:hypothetical protein
MKTFASMYLLSLIVTGCSPETALTATEEGGSAVYAKESSEGPANAANDKDYTGIIYYRLLDAYYALPPDSVTLQDIIDKGDSLAFLDPGFLALADLQLYHAVTLSDLEPYTTAQGNDINILLSQEYGSKARDVVEAITEGLATLKNSDATYEEAYSYLVGLEQEVIDDPLIPDVQASAILVTSSLLRHGMHHDKKRKRRDRDWDWMTTSIAATANAALESEAQAIVVSFATDVYQD